jgi:hypothetical protein
VLEGERAIGFVAMRKPGSSISGDRQVAVGACSLRDPS